MEDCKVKLIAVAAYILLIILPAFAGSEESRKNDSRDRESKRVLPIEEFVRLAVKNDTVFDEILIDELTLNYQNDLKLLPGDFVISARAQYDLFFSREKGEPEAVFSLSKLFPETGTDVSLSYKRTPSPKTETPASELQFLISQPVARNAFGSTTRLRERIIGIETDIARYQIVEACEDYMASLISLYYDWFSACENLKIGEMSYNENLKLKRNIYRRREQKIALPIDVNKVELLILGKKEDLLELRERYARLTNLVKKAVRHESDVPLIPSNPSAYHAFDIDFDREYREFTRNSRTYRTLGLLKKHSSLEVEKYAADLLPSTNLLAGYKVQGDDWQIKNEDKIFFAGVSLEWPVPDKTGRAAYEISKVVHRKTALSNENKYLELKVNLRNIYIAIQRERELAKIAEEKIGLAGSVLKDEADNYSFGRVTLNDYLDAVNRLDQNKFSRISRLVTMKKLIVEWLRLTDRLVGESVLGKRPE